MTSACPTPAIAVQWHAQGIARRHPHVPSASSPASYQRTSRA